MSLFEILRIVIPAAITAIIGFLLGKWQTNRMIRTTKSPAFRFDGSEKIGIEKIDEVVRATSDRLTLKIINKGSGPAFKISIQCERAGKQYILSGSPDSFDLCPTEERSEMIFSYDEPTTDEDLRKNNLIIRIKYIDILKKERKENFEYQYRWDGKGTYISINPLFFRIIT